MADHRREPPALHGVASSCSADCACCGAEELCETRVASSERPFRGGRFALASLVTFGLPVGLALLGALSQGSQPTAGFVRAAGGFVLGAFLASIFVKTILKPTPQRLDRPGKEADEKAEPHE